MPDLGSFGGRGRAPSGRVLGLDLGQARIGVAISDERRRVAVAFGTIRTGAPADLKAIARLVADNGVIEVVVGMPLSLSGASGAAAHRARAFAGTLSAFLKVPVSLQDERLSTVEAERGLSEAGIDGRGRRKVVDQAAAAIILQAFLDRTAGGAGSL